MPVNGPQIPAREINILNSVTQSQQRQDSVLRDIRRHLPEDDFDVNRAMHGMENRLDNRLKDISAQQKALILKGEAPEGSTGANPFKDDKITQFYLDSLKDIVSGAHRLTQDEMKQNLSRMDRLMRDLSDDSNVKERDVLHDEYTRAVDFMRSEYSRRSSAMSGAMEAVAKVSEQYLDVQGLLSGFVDHNPVLMGVYRIAAQGIRGFREKKAREKKDVQEDQRRRRYAEYLEGVKQSDYEKEQKRRKLLADAQEEAIKSGVLDIDQKEVQESISKGISDGMSGFKLPADEFSGTGDAPLTADDLQGILGVTGGGLFERMPDDTEEERQETINSLRSSAESLEAVSNTASRGDELERKTRENLAQITARQEEREEDKFEKVQRQYQDEHIEKMDDLVDAVGKQNKMFEKAGKAGAGLGGLFGGGGGGDSLMDNVVEGVAGAAAGGLLGKVAGKLGGKFKFLGKLAGGAAGLFGGAGLAKAAGGLTESFAPVAAKGISKSGAIAKVADAAKAPFQKIAGSAGTALEKGKSILGKGSKSGAAGAAKAATKSTAKTAGKTAAKTILKKIPGIGLLAGGAFAINRMLEGDYAAAGLELASGAASLIPGLGTAASIAIDAGLAARDFGAFDNDDQVSAMNEGVADGFQAAANQGKSVTSTVQGPDEALERFSRETNQGISNVNVAARSQPEPAWYKPWVPEKKIKPIAYTPDRTPVYPGEGYRGKVLITRQGKIWTPDDGGHAYAKPIEKVIEGGSQPQLEKSVATAKKASQSTASGSLDGGTKTLLEEIYEGEGTTQRQASRAGFASPYDVVLGSGKFGHPEQDVGKPLSQMTIGEVKAYQGTLIGRSRGKLAGVPSHLGSSAVGRMQIIRPTLKAQQKKLGLSDDTVFSPEVQDQITMSLVEGRDKKFTKFKEGKISEAQFQQHLSNEWASVAAPGTGRSTHNQPTGTSSGEIQAAMRAAKLSHQQAKLEARPEQKLEEVAKLELQQTQTKMAEKQAAAPPPVAVPTEGGLKRQNALSQQTCGQNSNMAGTTPSARNQDSTLQRISDRWMSQSVA